VTTLEEISTDAAANYAFWTERARLNLACYVARPCRADRCRLERAGFRAAIRNRKAQTYYR
jgi:hypothetical protein